MTSVNNISMTLGEFARLLEVYGGERARWPAEARAAAAHLVARDAQAQQLLAEAEALDRVLQKAPLPALAAEAALAERIVAAAQRSPRMVKLLDAPSATTGGALIQAASMPAAARTKALTKAPGRWRHLSREAGAVGFLAASLVIGVVIGHSSLTRQIAPDLAELAGLVSDRGDLVRIALSDEVMQ